MPEWCWAERGARRERGLAFREWWWAAPRAGCATLLCGAEVAPGVQEMWFNTNSPLGTEDADVM